MRRRLLVAALLFVVGGCGPAAAGGEDRAGPRFEPAVPPVVLRHAGAELVLRPWTACWTEGAVSGCMDGIPPDPLPHLGVITEDITVSFSRAGWSFTGYLIDQGDGCGTEIPIKLRQVDEHTWRITPAGPARGYEVYLDGRGPGGSVSVAAAIRTVVDAPMPPPSATAETFYQHDLVPDTSGFVLTIRQLRDTPGSVAARFVITASDGRQTTYQLAPANNGCQRGRVTLQAAAPPRGRVIEEIGQRAYRIRVELDLDGVRHIARATWPDDADVETDSIPLHFIPDLPHA